MYYFTPVSLWYNFKTTFIMSQITKQFPTIDEITPNISVEVFVMGKFEYVINSAEQLGNIRLWALCNNMTDEVEFHWNNHVITMDNRGNLSDFPYGFFDIVGRQLTSMIKFQRDKQTLTTYTV